MCWLYRFPHPEGDKRLKMKKPGLLIKKVNLMPNSIYLMGHNWKRFQLTQSVNSGQPFLLPEKIIFCVFYKKLFFELFTDWGS